MMRGIWNTAAATFLVIGLLLCPAFSVVADEQPGVIPYQGQLADQDGKPVSPTEPITLVFRVYSQPVGGTPFWHEVHDNVSVVGGRFSVLLGAREPFPDLALFRHTVYLGVTVDDGEPATADVEMRPRQAIVPVIASSYAANAGRAEHTPGEVPVGGITMYGGTEAGLPANWRICNGQRVEDPDSPFNGERVPDLRGLFVRGTYSRGGLQGGIDYHNIAHTHKIGGHTHYYTDEFNVEISEKDIRYSPMQQRPTLCIDGRSDRVCDYGANLGFGVNDIISDPNYNSLVIERGKDVIVHKHTGFGTTKGNTSWSLGRVNSAGSSIDNRPRHMDLHYIMRIK